MYQRIRFKFLEQQQQEQSLHQQTFKFFSSSLSMAEQDQVSDVNTSGPLTSNPYFLYPDDCLSSLVLVPEILQDSENYYEWKDCMETALRDKQKEAFIDGSLPCPPKTDFNYDKWSQCDAIVHSWLMKSVSPSIARSILFENSAKEAWDYLFLVYGQLSLPVIFMKIQATRQGSLSVNEYYSKLKSLWYRLNILRPLPPCTCPCTCGAADKIKEYINTDHVIKFLMGLNDSFHPVKSEVLGIWPLPSIASVVEMALRHERQLNSRQPQKGLGRGFVSSNMMRRS